MHPELNSEPSPSTPFLDHPEENLGIYNDSSPEKRSHRGFTPWMIHLGIFFTYSLVVFWMNGILSNADCHAQLLYCELSQLLKIGRLFATAPLQSALQYEAVAYNGQLRTMNKFRGDPSPELDEAWQSLFEHNNIRLTKEEMDKMNKSSIMLADGSGYYGQISAYHHLHCLVKDEDTFLLLR
jgi:hypothetical protein